MSTSPVEHRNSVLLTSTNLDTTNKTTPEKPVSPPQERASTFVTTWDQDVRALPLWLKIPLCVTIIFIFVWIFAENKKAAPEEALHHQIKKREEIPVQKAESPEEIPVQKAESPIEKKEREEKEFSTLVDKWLGKERVVENYFSNEIDKFVDYNLREYNLKDKYDKEIDNIIVSYAIDKKQYEENYLNALKKKFDACGYKPYGYIEKENLREANRKRAKNLSPVESLIEKHSLDEGSKRRIILQKIVSNINGPLKDFNEFKAGKNEEVLILDDFHKFGLPLYTESLWIWHLFYSFGRRLDLTELIVLVEQLDAFCNFLFSSQEIKRDMKYINDISRKIRRILIELSSLQA